MLAPEGRFAVTLICVLPPRKISWPSPKLRSDEPFNVRERVDVEVIQIPPPPPPLLPEKDPPFISKPISA